MKKIAFLMATALLVSSSAAFAQGEMDAYRYSQSDLNGTARYLGMAGAFGALGGDISAMSANPAGLGIYRSSETVISASLSSVNTKTNWFGTGQKDNKTNFNLENIAYVGYFPTSNDVGIVSWNVGFSYNRAMNYNRSYTMRGTPQNSLSAYIADKTFGIELQNLQLVDGYDPYNHLGGNWLSVLGYEAGLIAPYSDQGNEYRYHSAFGNRIGDDSFERYSPSLASLNVKESGSLDLYNFSFATNISNVVFLGATFAVTDMSYSMYSFYDESFANRDQMSLENKTKTEGTGYAFNIGAIVRPVEFLRLGVAYNSSTWYKMTDYYDAKATSFIAGIDNRPLTEITPDNNPYTNYQFRSPDKWIFSAAAIFGQSALLSVDYELKNYKGMRISNDMGQEYKDNELIRTDFGMSKLLKVGAEVKVTPQLSVRAGGAWETSPMKSHMKDGSQEVYTSGTIPNYTINNGTTSYYTVGLGYRFNTHFYTDLACVFKKTKEDVFAFSNTYEDEKNGGGLVIGSTPASMKTNTTRVALTFGYKF